MKKALYNISFLSIAILFIHSLASCTLSMEDWIETEENKGYDELVTEETDLYTLKYQYKDHTRSITENIREYIVSVEADSIIYFMDNLPEEWIPQVGGCVVSNCCTHFPMGLIGSVIAVEKEAGMIKVTTTPCELEDAYEDFDLDMDMDVISSENPEMMNTTRSACPKTRGMEGPDSVISTLDWTMFNLTSKKEKVKCVNGEITRADEDEDYFDRDIDRDTTYTTETNILTLDENNYPLKPVVEKTKKYVDKASISLSYVSKINVKKKVKLKSNYEYTKQIETNGLRLSVLVGKGKDLKKPKSEKQERAEAVDALTSYLIASGQAFVADPLPVREEMKNEKQFLHEFPLGTLPFGLIIRVKPIFDFNVSLVGMGEVTWWTAKTQTEVTISNGKKTEKDPVKLTAPSNSYSASIAGKFNLSVGLEGFVGLGKKVGVGMSAKAYGIGGFLAATLDLEGKIMYKWDTDVLNGSQDSGISLTGNIEFGAKALGGRWGEYTFASKKVKVWDGISVNFFPKVSVTQNMEVIMHEDKGGKYKQFKITYSYPSLGIFATLLNSYYYPRLRIYKGDNTDNSAKEFEDIKPDKKVSWVTTGKAYTFTYKTYDVDQDFTAVPMLDCGFAVACTTLFYDNKRYIDKECAPIIRYMPSDVKNTKVKRVVYQQYGGNIDVDYGIASGIINSILDAKKYYQYEFCLPFYMYNAPAMSQYWSDFGIYYTIKCGSSNKTRYKSLFSKIKRSKYYVPRIRVITNVMSDNSNNVTATAYLYYVLKDDPDKIKRSFDTVDSWPFCWKKYTDHTGLSTADMIINYHNILKYPYDDSELYEWETEVGTSDYINIDTTN